MFKAHSLATLNVQDAHLKLLDGSTKPDPHKFFTYKVNTSQWHNLGRIKSAIFMAPTLKLLLVTLNV